MISVICACNNKKLFEEMLLPSVKRQKCGEWEMICVDGKEHGFSSAAETLNFGASLAKGDILLFVHQDIEFLSDDCFDRITAFCQTENLGVGGAAGSVAAEKSVYSSVLMDADRRQAGKECKEPTEADSLDECCFFMKRENFKGFDDYGSTWHFYAVEYSFRCRLAGERVMVFPVPVYHLSPGWSLDGSYFKTLKKVGKRYRGKLKVISTTMGIYKLGPLFNLNVAAHRLKAKIKKLIKGTSV